MAKLTRSLLLVVLVLAAAACGPLAQGAASGARINPPLAILSASTYALDMFDAKNGWTFTADQVEHTTDGAQTFRIVTPSGVKHIDGTFLLDAQRAWVIGSSTLHYTSDAGATWQAIPMHPALVGDPVFVDEQHGWLVTNVGVDNHTTVDETLWRTVDGGFNWKQVYETKYKIDIEPNVQKADCSAGFAAWTSDTHGIAGVSCPGAASPSLRVTDDGGATWRSVPLPPLPALPGLALGTDVGSIHVDRNGDLVTMVSRCIGQDGTSCQFYGELYRSTDGGATWTTGSVVWGVGDALVADSQHVWLPDACSTNQCAGPLLFTTADGGVTWKSIPLPQELWPNMHGARAFSVASPTDAFVVVSNEFQPAPKYYRTTDGGQTFTQFAPRLVS